MLLKQPRSKAQWPHTYHARLSRRKTRPEQSANSTISNQTVIFAFSCWWFGDSPLLFCYKPEIFSKPSKKRTWERESPKRKWSVPNTFAPHILAGICLSIWQIHINPNILPSHHIYTLILTTIRLEVSEKWLLGPIPYQCIVSLNGVSMRNFTALPPSAPPTPPLTIYWKLSSKEILNDYDK